MDLISYAMAKAYIDKALVGGGALKGKNCVIDKIEEITGGHRVIFKWTLDDGTVETDTMDVMDGTNGTDGKDGKDGAILSNALTATVSIGGISAGTAYPANTDAETIFDDLLAPDNKLHLCEGTMFDWSSGTMIAAADNRNDMIAQTNYDGHPAPIRTIEGITYYPIKIKNNVETVIITPAQASQIVVNAGKANGNVYTQLPDAGGSGDWTSSAKILDAAALRDEYGIDEFYIIGKVAKSDWSQITDHEAVRPTIQYIVSVPPTLPAKPTAEGEYILKCTVNSSGDSQLSWELET